MSANLALDLGTAFTRVADEHGTLLFEEPTVAAVDGDSGRLLAFGSQAHGLAAQSAGRVVLVRPVRQGQLVDLELGEEVLAEVLYQIGSGRFAHPRVLACVHVGATEVQRRALDRSLKKAGVRHVRFVESPIACAVGGGYAIEEPTGRMVVDVGAGRSDVGVLALGGIVTSGSLASGSDDFDSAIRDHLARRHGLLVDRAHAAMLRDEIGTVRHRAPDTAVELSGRDASSGAVASVVVARSEIGPILLELVAPIFATAVSAICEAPPDLANDLLTGGLLLAGGGARLDGFDAELARATGVPVHVADPGGRLAVLGAASCLTMLDVLADSVSAAQRR